MGSRLRKKLKEVWGGKFRRKNLFGELEDQQRDKKIISQSSEILGNAEASEKQAHRISASFLCFYGHWWKAHVQLEGRTLDIWEKNWPYFFKYCLSVDKGIINYNNLSKTTKIFGKIKIIPSKLWCFPPKTAYVFSLILSH